MKVERFEDLTIWQEARHLSKLIYEITQKEPFNKDFKFREQIRSSAGSVMDNIAEGFERDGNKEFIQFLSIAKGSCGECRSQLYRAKDNQYISSEVFEELLTCTANLSKQISGLINYLKKSQIPGIKYKNTQT